MILAAGSASASALPYIYGTVLAFATALIGFFVARRTTRGSVQTSDAQTVFNTLKEGYSKLIEDALKQIDAYQQDLGEMRARLIQAEAEITVLREQAAKVVALEDELQKTEETLKQAKASSEALREQIARLQEKANGK